MAPSVLTFIAKANGFGATGQVLPTLKHLKRFNTFDKMKDSTNTVRILGNLAPTLLLLVVGTAQTFAQIIPAGRTVSWVPGVTVGVLQPIPNRTNIVDVTKAPYFADKTGMSNAAPAINQAINDAGWWMYGSNTVIYLPAGNYKVTSPISILKNDITLRGDGIRKTYINQTAGADDLVVGSGILANITYPIVAGSTKGSTNLVVSFPPGFTPNAYGWLSVGDLCDVSQAPLSVSNPMHVIQSGYGLTGLSSMNYVTAINGNNVSLALPLPYDFTNQPSFVEQTIGSEGGSQAVSGTSLEGISFTMTNPPTGQSGTGGEIVRILSARNILMTNCELSFAYGHCAVIEQVVGATISGCVFDNAQGSGSGHGGLVTAMSGALVENNVFANTITTGIELDGGDTCAFFGNYFTNTGQCFDMHGSHPLMELFEGNVSDDYFETDGYYGSCSHFTFFRNDWTGGGYLAIKLNRWSRYMNIVGNVLGQATTVGGAWHYEMDETNQVFPAIFSFGLPNIGNQFYRGVITNDAAWNYPGANYFDSAVTGLPVPFNTFTFTNTQGPTNIFTGNFAGMGIIPYALNVRLIFQDNENTNLYHSLTSGNGIYPLSITTSNMTINSSYTVSNGWTAYVAGNAGYQQVQATDKNTHLVTGNYDYYHQAVTWDTNGVQTIPTSLIYPNGAPGWWGTNRWPAIDPLASPMVSGIPAQARYANLPATTNSQSGITLPTNPISQPTTLLAPPSNLLAAAPAQNSASGTNSANGTSSAAGLVGWYQLMETSGSTASDSSGSGNLGTTVGAPTWESPGVLLNGTSQYVVLARNNGLPLYTTAASNNVTVSVWVYLERGNSDQVLYSEGENGGSGRFLMDFNNSANPGKISIYLPSTYSPSVLRASTTLSSNTWYNIVWTDNAGTAQLYINGSPDGANFNYTPAVSSSTGGAAIGAAYDGQAGDTYGFTHGIIDDVRLWNYALPSSQASTIYNGGRNGGGGAMAGWWKLVETSGLTAHDSSGNTNTGTTIGSPTWGSPGVFLNGTNQFVVLAQNNSLPLYSTAASNSLTVSLWVYLEGASSDQVLYSEAGNGSGRFLLDFNNSANPGKISIFLPTTFSPATLKANTTLALNTWYNIVWTDNDGAAQLYINGSPDGGNFNYTPAISSGTGGVAIGAVYDGQPGDTYGFSQGNIADVRLWKYSLPLSQVSTIYSGGRATQ